MLSCVKKITATLILLLLSILVTACRKSMNSNDAVSNMDQDSYVYVPYDNIDLKVKMGTSITDIFMMNDKLYYIVKFNNVAQSYKEMIYCLDLNQESSEPEILWEYTTKPESDEYEAVTIKRVLMKDGGSISIVENCPIIEGSSVQTSEERDHSNSLFFMKKTDQDNNEVFSMDITSYLKEDDTTYYIVQALESKDGSIFLSDGYKYIWVFNEKGEYVTTTSLDTDWMNESYTQSYGLIDEGRAAYLKKDVTGYSLYVYNERKKNFTESYDNLPEDCLNIPLSCGVNQGNFICDNNALYEYHMTNQECHMLLHWIDVDLDVDYIQNVFSLSDGNIAVYSKDSSTNRNNIVLLKKVLATEVKIKKTILLSSLGISTALENAVVEFNKNNEDYRVVIKDYTSSLSQGSSIYTDYYAAKQKFQLDIVSNRGVDLFLANDLDLQMLEEKGIIEDLNPYLDQSQTINRSDLIEPVLDAYEVDGKLCAIPKTFYVDVMVGRTSELGDRTGWTIEDLVTYANEYPDADLFSNMYNMKLLDYFLGSDITSYVNWKTGECYFNTDNFKKILEMSKKYPGVDGFIWKDQTEDIFKHKVLLSLCPIGTPWTIRLYEKYFGQPITLIGYPNKDSNGVFIEGLGGLCINSSSQNKEVAWAFIESFLAQSPDSNDRFYLPTKKSLYDQMIQEAMTPNYVTNPDGSLWLDENGNPKEIVSKPETYEFGDVTYYPLTQEEADDLWNIINRSNGVFYNNSQLMHIIEEEIAPYFIGQKTVDEVTDIIQNRVKLYVNENR